MTCQVTIQSLSASHAMRCQKLKGTSVMDVLQTSMQVKKKLLIAVKLLPNLLFVRLL